MSTQERILAAARKLAQTQPIHDISLTAVAKEADVSWPTVRRYLGNKQQLQDFLSREMPQADQPLDTRSRILASARRVFAQHGYAGATLDAIAADASLTKGAVYWHFASKEDLFLALLKEHLETPLNITADQVQALFSQMSPEAAIKTIVTQQLHYAYSHPDWCRLAMEFYIQSRQAEVQKALKELDSEAQERAIATLLRHLQAQGLLNTAVDASVIATFWSALVNGLILLYVVDPTHNDPAAQADQIAQLLWQGLQPQAS